MDARLFETWFHEIFVPHVKKFCHNHGIEYKELLLLDNAPAYRMWNMSNCTFLASGVAEF